MNKTGKINGLIAYLIQERVYVQNAHIDLSATIYGIKSVVTNNSDLYT